MVRESPLAHLDRVAPSSRAYYVKRVCIVGAESTGKTAGSKTGGALPDKLGAGVWQGILCRKMERREYHGRLEYRGVCDYRNLAV